MSIIANEQAGEPVFFKKKYYVFVEKFHFACGVRKHFFYYSVLHFDGFFFVIKSSHCGGEACEGRSRNKPV
ncbi:hypothetical protein ID12_06860 [Bacillus altitudinis]|nr:hypothetical protein ID12_06860 [Bacillus altitudinis]